MLLPRLVLNVLTHPINCLLAVCMVWGEGRKYRGRNEGRRRRGREIEGKEIREEGC